MEMQKECIVCPETNKEKCFECFKNKYEKKEFIEPMQVKCVKCGSNNCTAYIFPESTNRLCKDCGHLEVEIVR